MKITDTCKEELLKKGFKEFKVNGLQNFVNSGKGCGFEIKSNHLNPYTVVAGEKIFNPTIPIELLEDAMTIFENTNKLISEVVEKQNAAKTYIETGELIEYIPETAIVPQNLTSELIKKHPGTIPCLLSMQQTNPNEIKTMLDANGNPVMKNGRPVQYVTGDYIQRCLNYACLFDWDFEGIETREDLIDDKTHLSVFGRLTIRTTEGKTISKTQWGGQILRAKMEPGDALKGANTDATKKCASQFGIARDVYGGEV